MNDEIQKALIELEESLEKLDKAAELIKEAGISASAVIEEASKTLKGVRKHMDDLKEKLDLFLANVGTLWEEQRKNVDQLVKKYEELAIATDALLVYIKKVDFPNRLDKIDSSVTSINLGIQNLMSQIMELKSELSGKIEVMAKKTEEEAAINKKRFVVLCVCIGITVVLIVISFILRL